VFQHKESISLGNSDKEIEKLMQSLISSHIIG
jgi:hypothetical protein